MGDVEASASAPASRCRLIWPTPLGAGHRPTASAWPGNWSPAKEYRLGTSLGSRILVHNSGEKAAVFIMPTWQVVGGHVAPYVKGRIELGVVIRRWRLREFGFPRRILRVDSPGIGIALNPDAWSGFLRKRRRGAILAECDRTLDIQFGHQGRRERPSNRRRSQGCEGYVEKNHRRAASDGNCRFQPRRPNGRRSSAA